MHESGVFYIDLHFLCKLYVSLRTQALIFVFYRTLLFYVFIKNNTDENKYFNYFCLPDNRLLLCF